MQTTKRKIIIKATIAVVIITGMWKCHRVIFYNKNNHLHTDYIASGIFEERFESFNGGVLMSNTITYYLTDSVSFRKYIGACDEDEIFKSKVYIDSVVTIKFSWKDWYISKKETPIDTLYFSISKLKEEGDFD